ncbi:MAG TPA: carboxypeptidase-like regulatory domain-containing protein, partial [Xanthomonadales bacterium]|nr:carboxypeptidase-like regulatory domain-containing protein [Xanthomonadales bacterium]
MRLPSLAFAACVALAAPIATHAAGAPATPKHASTISGTVTRTADASAVVGANVLVLTPAGDFVTFAQTGPGGTYTVDAGPGTFLVLVAAPRLVTELYNDVACPAFECNLSLATQIPLAHGGAVTGIDFALAPQPKLTGVVTGGSPVVAQAGVEVTAFTADGNPAGTTATAADGSYELFFDPVSVVVRTSNFAQLVDELHPDIACPFGACGTTGATVFTLTAGQSQGGVDFVLARGASIGGEVTLAANGQPLEFATVGVYAADASFLANFQTGTDGSWRVATGMLPGTYRAAIEGASSLQGEVWDDHPCVEQPGNTCNVAAGDPIVVAAQQTRTDIDFALVRGTGVLSGTTRRFGTNTPLFGVQLQLLSSDGVQLVAQAQSGFD